MLTEAYKALREVCAELLWREKVPKKEEPKSDIGMYECVAVLDDGDEVEFKVYGQRFILSGQEWTIDVKHIYDSWLADCQKKGMIQFPDIYSIDVNMNRVRVIRKTRKPYTGEKI
jgi:hypothetical protein